MIGKMSPASTRILSDRGTRLPDVANRRKPVTSMDAGGDEASTLGRDGDKEVALAGVL
jgi:hypothetical protein